MDFQDADTKEFISEVTELLDIAQLNLMHMNSGTNFPQDYDAVFRAFHTIKGASGMMSWTVLQAHMHQLENIFTQFKGKTQIENSHINFFLSAIDVARQLLEGNQVNFDYAIQVTAEATTFATPLTLVADTTSTPPSTKTIRHFMSGKVVIIDDNSDIVEALSDILGSQGFEVVSYTDPEKAVLDFPKTNPYLVLSDCNMPKLSGMQVLQKLAAFDAHIPLIFVSGHITKEVLLESIALGVYGVVEKPFDNKKVVQLALNGYRRYEMIKLLNRSIKLITSELNQLLTQHRELQKAAA